MPFSGTITDSSSNGFTFYLNGQNTTLTTTATLNTSNTAVGVEFDGLGNLGFPASGANPGGSASVYSRVGYFDALNTSGGTLPNTTGNQSLVTLPSLANNLAGKTLNLQDLTFNAVTNVNAALIASSGTLNFNADSAMYNSGTTFTQGTFNFAPTAIYRLGNDCAFDQRSHVQLSDWGHGFHRRSEHQHEPVERAVECRSGALQRVGSGRDLWHDGHRAGRRPHVELALEYQLPSRSTCPPRPRSTPHQARRASAWPARTARR